MKKLTGLLAMVLSLSLVSCVENNDNNNHTDKPSNPTTSDKVPSEDLPTSEATSEETSIPTSEATSEPTTSIVEEIVITKDNQKAKDTYEASKFTSFKGTYDEWIESINSKDGVAFNAFKEIHKDYTKDHKTWVEEMDAGTLEVLKVFEVKFDTLTEVTIPSVKVLEGTKVNKVEDPTREGYTFNGWALNDEVYNFDNVVNDNITLKALWLEPDLGNTLEEAIEVIVGKNEVATQVKQDTKYLKFNCKSTGYYSIDEVDQIQSIVHKVNKGETIEDVNVTVPTSPLEEIYLEKGITYYLTYKVKNTSVNKINLSLYESAVLHKHVVNEEFKTRAVQTTDGLKQTKAHAYLSFKTSEYDTKFSFKLYGDTDTVIKFYHYDYNDEYKEVTLEEPVVKDEQRVYTFNEPDEYFVDITSTTDFRLKMQLDGYDTLDSMDMYTDYEFSKRGTYRYKLNVTADGCYYLKGDISRNNINIYRINRNYNLETGLYDYVKYQKVKQIDFSYLLEASEEYVITIKFDDITPASIHFEGIESADSCIDFDPYKQDQFKLGKLYARHYHSTKDQYIFFEALCDHRQVYEIVDGKYVQVTKFQHGIQIYHLEKDHHYVFSFYYQDQGQYDNLYDVTIRTLNEDNCEHTAIFDHPKTIEVRPVGDYASILSVDMDGYFTISAPVLDNLTIYQYAKDEKGNITYNVVDSYLKDEENHLAVYHLTKDTKYALHYKSHQPKYEHIAKPYYIHFDYVGEQYEGYQIMRSPDMKYGYIDNNRSIITTIGNTRDIDNSYLVTYIYIKVLSDGTFSFKYESSSGLYTYSHSTSLYINDNYSDLLKLKDNPNKHYSNIGGATISCKAGDIIKLRIQNGEANNTTFEVILKDITFEKTVVAE